MVTSNVVQLSILTISEDSSDDSHETIAAIAKKMLLLIDPHTQTHRIEFEPQNERAARAMQGSKWKSRSPRDRQKLIDLWETIATKVVEDPIIPGFVLFHVDGDRKWAERATSENVQRFEEILQIHVGPIVADTLAKKGRSVEFTARMTRVRRLVPFYSIEAWVYQNTSVARRLCEEHCGHHLEQM
jgi:hypothetical protein